MRRRILSSLAVLTLVLTGAGAASAATQVTQKNPGGIVAVGPVNGENGFPAWYQDSNGLRVEPCLDDQNPLCGFLPGDIPDDTVPISFPGNFPEEFFYMLASSQLDLPGGGKATLTLGLEGAFANAVQQGDQQTFARQRIVVKGAPADTTLTFREPYGTITIDTDGTGAGKLVEDISPAAGNFDTALKGNLGPFLRWDPAVAPAAPDGYLGDPAQDHSVVGSPFGFNKFSVTGGGLDLETDQFTVQGKLSTNQGVQADAAVVDGSFLDVFATSAGSQIQVEGQDGLFDTTPMRTDSLSNRFYARVKLNGPAPAQVKVVNISDKPASTSIVAVTNPSGIVVHKAEYDGTNLTVAATSTVGYPLTVVGVGTLTSEAEQTFPVGAPPRTVTVKTAAGGTATLPVVVTGGDASPGALPPVDPQPDPNAGSPVAVATTASTVLPRGMAIQLNGSGSTGAVSYRWTQVSGPPVTLSSSTDANPTVSAPVAARTTDTTPFTGQPAAGQATLQLVATGLGGVESAPATVTLNVVDDQVTIDAGGRHRLNTELRATGTSTVPGFPGILAPATSVIVYNTTGDRANAPVKLGTAPVDTLGAWSLRLKPGPTRQVTSILVQSTRGGSATGTLATK
ncbi:MAG: hypothetical protein HOQ22_06360 [Nocardioidaceae bacterium]|nr:hypothetical protein [Nocardioidaceae bacterium]